MRGEILIGTLRGSGPGCPSIRARLVALGLTVAMTAGATAPPGPG
ncbi:MAG TPA: hypothetical protein VF198_07865 [Vicinamibacterales bacterium]